MGHPTTPGEVWQTTLRAGFLTLFIRGNGTETSSTPDMPPKFSVAVWPHHQSIRAPESEPLHPLRSTVQARSALPETGQRLGLAVLRAQHVREVS